MINFECVRKSMMVHVFHVFVFLFLARTGEVIGCSCGLLPEIKTQKDVEKYDFVALVKINGLTDSSFTKGNYTNQTSLGSIEILELYKGKDNHLKVSFWGRGSSCDMGVGKEAVWIIFGNYESNFITTSYCTHSTMYKNSLGESDYIYERSWKKLNTLRELYQVAPHKNPTPAKGKHQLFYPNGKLESEAYYKNGLLEGKQTFYYATGELYGEEFYVKGKRNGKSVWYWRKTQHKQKEFNYKNGVQTGNCFRYERDGSLSNLYIHDKKGRFLKHKQFDDGFIVRIFEVHPKTKDFITTDYYPRKELGFDDKTGDMIMKTHSFKADKIRYISRNDSSYHKKEYYEWDIHGNRTRKALYKYEKNQTIVKEYNQTDVLIQVRIQDSETYKLILEQEFDPKTGKLLKETKY